jgi:hypothetical protein
MDSTVKDPTNESLAMPVSESLAEELALQMAGKGYSIDPRKISASYVELPADAPGTYIMRTAEYMKHEFYGIDRKELFNEEGLQKLEDAGIVHLFPVEGVNLVKLVVEASQKPYEEIFKAYELSPKRRVFRSSDLPDDVVKKINNALGISAHDDDTRITSQKEGFYL